MTTINSTLSGNDVKQTILNIYNKKGLNTVNAFLRKNNIQFKRTYQEFGLENKKNRAEKSAYLASAAENELRLHYYSVQVRKRGTGWTYNILRATTFELI